MTPIRRALLSVSNKDGLLEFAQALQQRGVAMLSTGGTATLLERGGIPVTQVSSHTGFPEIMDGRVKTLHPKIHGGLLGRRDVDDAVMRQHGIEPIDLLVVNLYPFAATVAKPDCTYEDAIENIDIGGPAMVRAAAKNHDRVAVIVDPLDYAAVLDELVAQRRRSFEATRKRLAAKAFAHTASYDSAVASYLARVNEGAGEFPQSLALHFHKRMDLRYGENPHQTAAFYRVPDAQGASIGRAKQLQGKDALVQQHRRRRYRVRMRAAVRGSGVRHRQARQSVRRGDRERHARGLRPRVQDRSDVRLRRHHRVQPRRSRPTPRARSSSGSSSS